MHGLANENSGKKHKRTGKMATQGVIHDHLGQHTYLYATLSTKSSGYIWF